MADSPILAQGQKNWFVWFVRHKIITVILILIAIGIIGSALNNGGGKQTNNNETPATNQNATTTENIPQTEAKKWQKVFDFSATANKQSETFHLNGGQQKIIYNTTGGQMSICSIYVMEEGTSLEKNGGFPIVMIDGSKSDETMMRKDAGDYYFDLTVANGSCTIELQELR